jgi:hypothetical protein
MAEDIGQASKIEAHLAKVLASPEFSASPQLSAFLSHIVLKKLSGESDRIKAYTIATEALGRPPDFDPQNDPIVRVQAGRLRQVLLAYYANPSADDSMRISLPTGSYVPDIAISPPKDELQPISSARRARVLSRATLGIALAALALAVFMNAASIKAWLAGTPQADPNPLGMPAVTVNIAASRQIPAWFNPDLFKSALEYNLSRFDEFAVVTSAKPTGLSYRLDLEFSGEPGAVLSSARLLRMPEGRIVWGNRFTVPEDEIGSYALLASNAKLASTLGQPYGVVYAQFLREPGKTEAQRCLLDSYEYFQRPSPAIVGPAARCLGDIVKANPGNHAAHIMAAYMDVEGYRSGLGGKELLDQALDLARKAVALRPDSAGSQQVLMEALNVLGAKAEAMAAGAEAVKLNPNDSDVVADYGCSLIFEGRYSEGETYAKRAAKLNPARPPWHSFCLFVAANNEGRFAEADDIASGLSGGFNAYALVPTAIAAARRNDPIGARDAVGALVTSDRKYAVDVMAALKDLGVGPQAAQPLIEGLSKAGLKTQP